MPTLTREQALLWVRDCSRVRPILVQDRPQSFSSPQREKITGRFAPITKSFRPFILSLFPLTLYGSKSFHITDGKICQE